MQQVTEADRRQRWGAALICAISGGFLAYAVGAGLPGLHTPPVIGLLAAAVFFAAGAALFLQALGCARAAMLPIFLLLVAMAGIGGWIGFGPGSRECHGRLNARRFMAGEWTCRAVFGGGALLTGSLGLLILRSTSRGRAGSSNRAV